MIDLIELLFIQNLIIRMKRTIGITRNRMEALQKTKNGFNRKKNIFKTIGKDDQAFEGLSNEGDTSHNTNHLLSATTKNSANSIQAIQSNPCSQIYQQAKTYLLHVSEYRSKMSAQIKLRMSSFKDSEIKIYEQNISKYSSKAVDNLLKAQKILTAIRKVRGVTETQERFFRNMQKSLALEIREISKALRNQQKEYFDRLRAYETGTANKAIQLKQQDRQRMKDEYEEMQVCSTQMGEDEQRNKQLTQLVKSINQLTGIYKQLNELVIEQGSLIDRIDFNIEATMDHVERGVEHLKGANEKASSPCAQKCMVILIILILAMACVIGFKMSKSG